MEKDMPCGRVCSLLKRPSPFFPMRIFPLRFLNFQKSWTRFGRATTTWSLARERLIENCLANGNHGVANTEVGFLTTSSVGGWGCHFSIRNAASKLFG